MPSLVPRLIAMSLGTRLLLVSSTICPVSRYFGDPLNWGPGVPKLPVEWGRGPHSTGSLGTPGPQFTGIIGTPP